MDGHACIEDRLVIPQPFDQLLLDVVLVLDLANDLLQEVLDGDQSGGTAGLVTIEDLLEEIVGEIQDEYDVEEKLIERLGDHEAIFDARVSVHDVNETLDTLLTNGEYDTIGGLVY